MKMLLRSLIVGLALTARVGVIAPVLVLAVSTATVSPAYAVADLALVGARGTGAAATCTTTAGSVSAGDTILVATSFDPTATINSIPLSGSGSDTLSIVGSVTTGQGKLALYAKENATGGASVSVTINFSVNAFATCHLFKATGVATASLDTGSLVANASDTTTPWTITSNAFAQANNIVLSCAEINSGSSGAYASSNFTVLSSEPDVSSFWTSGCAELYVTATTAVTPSWTRTNSSNAAAALLVIGLKEAGGGGGGTVCNPLSGRCGAAAPPVTLH